MTQDRSLQAASRKLADRWYHELSRPECPDNEWCQCKALVEACIRTFGPLLDVAERERDAAQQRASVLEATVRDAALDHNVDRPKRCNCGREQPCRLGTALWSALNLLTAAPTEPGKEPPASEEPGNPVATAAVQRIQEQGRTNDPKPASEARACGWKWGLSWKQERMCVLPFGHEGLHSDAEPTS